MFGESRKTMLVRWTILQWMVYIGLKHLMKRIIIENVEDQIDLPMKETSTVVRTKDYNNYTNYKMK